MKPFEDHKRLISIIHTSTEAIIIVGDRGRILVFNSAAENMFGCAENEALGTHFERFIPRRLRAGSSSGLEQWYLQNTRDANIRRLSWGLRNNGEKFPCRLSISLFEVDGSPELTVIVRDITERRRSEAALRHRVEFERLLFDLSKTFIGLPEGSVAENMERGFARVGAFLEMDRLTLLEVSRDRSVLKAAYSWSKPGVPNSAPLLTKSMQPWWVERVLSGEMTLASHIDDLPDEAVPEKEYLRQRGVASVASIPLRIGGEIAGAMSFVTVHRHVEWTTELVNRLRTIGDIFWNAMKRRQAMQEVLAAQESARESEERFRLVANTAPVMIWMSSPDRMYNYVNQRWLDFTGRTESALLGHGWLDSVHPDDRERCVQVRSQAFERCEPFQLEYRLLRHDSMSRWIFAQAVPRFNVDGSLAGYMGSAIDVTDRKEAEEALRQSHEALRERKAELELRTAQLSQMASDLTLAEQHAREQLAKNLHDGLQQLLVSAAMSLDRQVKRDMLRGSDSVESLIQTKGHLDEAIAAARSLSVELFPPVLHGSGLPDALTWLAERTQNEYGLVVQVSVDPRANSERKDVRTLLFESVRELLFNAVKHAQADYVTLELAAGANDTLCITVSDQGKGFDTAALADRTKAGQAGWGLFSIRERLSLLGGRFEVDSAIGKGTRFRLIAPRGATIVAGIAALEQAGSGGIAGLENALPSKGHALRILIVDDHASVRTIFRELIEEQLELLVVGEAANGFEAIAQAHALLPDVILMDISMPELDGIEATRRIHADLPSIRIYGLSTQLRTPGLHEIERAGAAGFFTKGDDTERLIDHLMSIQSRLSRAAHSA